ncbi:hypothetical protein AAC387_Pa08g2032 [Persea americana]|eukprot:TRINITY_DN2770_c1_g1_i4.p1 TRINITY_DN2770_c1_g1~~TRINITY_DN2770_c1_g1_i4.p1  ORF type:complete len:159 (+),score=14.66 TRINITY_DN2770_c1_g1_i4:411-887(+)
MAAPSTIYDYYWYPYSEATHHLNADLRILYLPLEYTGQDSVKIGNGTRVAISHIGHSFFRSPQRACALNDVLHVPSVSHNLLSVSKFTTDNNVYFEFHLHSFFVKDQHLGNILLRGQNKGGFYCLPVDSHAPSQPTVLIGERTSMDMWHLRFKSGIWT